MIGSRARGAPLRSWFMQLCTAMAASPTVLYPPPAPSDSPATSAKLLTVDKVSLEYRTRERIVRATHEVSFDVYRGDRFVLLGPSGCGKSTLLKAVAGFIEPTAGTIRIDDKPVRGPGTDRIVVFQEFDQLPPWKTVLQNVAFPLRVGKKLSRAEARERALHFLDKVGLAAFADAYPHTLSGGMKQRVAIARAADGRTVRRARRTHAPQDAGGTSALMGRGEFHAAVRHALDRGSADCRQPHLAADPASRPGSCRVEQPSIHQGQLGTQRLSAERCAHSSAAV